MKPWAEVEATPEFQSLSPVDQSKAQNQYFEEIVAPQIEEQDRESARSQFFTEFGRTYLPEDSGQGAEESAIGAGIQSLAKVGTGTVEGIGQFQQSYIRNLTPIGWAQKLGIPGAEEVLEKVSAIPAGIESSAAGVQEAVEEAIPTNPLYADTGGQKIAGVTGQVVGQLGTMLTGAAITKLPRVIQAIGLGQAGLLGMESGYAEADRLGVTEPWKRDVLGASYALAEAGVEGAGGFGSIGFSRALTGEVKDLLTKGALRTFGKTALVEGLEEPVTGTLQSAASNALAEQDPQRPGYSINGARLPSIDPSTGEFWSSRGEEFLLGMYGGALFGGAQVAMSKPKLDQARRLQQQVDLTVEVMAQNPELTEEEKTELEELKSLQPNLRTFIEESTRRQANPATQAINTATESAAAAGMPQAASAMEIYNQAAAAATTQAEPLPVEERVPAGTTMVPQYSDMDGKQYMKVNGVWTTLDGEVATPEIAQRLDVSPNQYRGELIEEMTASEDTPVEIAGYTGTILEGPEAAGLTEVVHYGDLPEGLASIDPLRPAQKQQKKGRNYGGFYVGPESHASLYPGTRYGFDIAPNARVFRVNQVIDRIPVETLQTLRDQGVDIIYGKDIRGKEQGVVLNMAALAEQKTTFPEAPSVPSDNVAGSRVQEGEPILSSGIPTETVREVARSQIGTLPSAENAWVGSRKEILADDSIRQIFIQNEKALDPKLTTKQASASFDRFVGSPKTEGFTMGGRTYLISDGIRVTKKDGNVREAVKRVLRHEDTHIAIDAVVGTDPKMKAKWEGLKKRLSSQKLDDLVQRRYPSMSNWRKNSETFNHLAHEYFAEQMERQEMGMAVDDPSLLERFIQFIREVMAKITGREVSIQEIRDFVRAGRVARSRMLQTENQTAARPSTQEDAVPPMPQGEPAFTDWIPVVDKTRAMELAWRPFAVAWQEENPNGTTEQLNAAWAAEIANPESPAIAQGQTEAFMEARQSKTGPAVYSPEPTQTEPEVTPTRFSLQDQDPLERLQQINEAFSYQTKAGQQEGLDPTKATTDQRTFAADGTPVNFSRQGMTNAQQEALAKESIDLLSELSPDGKSKTFGSDLMAYLSGKSSSIYGQRLSDLQQTAILNHLDFAVQERASMGIDGAEVQRVRSQRLSQAGAILQTAANNIYEPLRDIATKAKELTDKTLREEGVDPVKIDAEIKAEVKAAQTEIAKDISTPEVKASILDGAQNDADELYELGLSGLDPKFAAMIRERDMRVARLGRLIKLEAMLSGGPKGAKASLAALPDNMTLDEVRAMIAQEKAEIEKLESTIEAASKKEKRKAKEAKAKEVEDNTTFTSWVMGGESAGVDAFDDLIKKYSDPNGFDRFAFQTLLTNSFKQADPNMIMGVVQRVADYIDGAAVEEGAEVDAAKPVNYDARVKRLVATEIAKGSNLEVIQIKKDPFTELTKQRLKGEISTENFQKELVKLGIEEQGAYAYLQKVDQDRARIGDAKAQRELNAQAKKDMAKALRDSQKSDREAQAQIDQLAKQFSDTPNLTKQQATSELKAASNSFLGKEGPPITQEEFLSRLEKLNVGPQKAQNLLRLLQESRRRDSAVRYAKAVQKAQEARKKAIASAVKKLEKKGATQTKLRQQSTFVNSILGLMEGGIMDSETIRQAFAQAYDLHGLTPEVLKNLGERLQQIQAMKEGIPKETLLLQFNQTLNEVAPTSSFSNYSYTSLMGYILGAVSTLGMQITGLNRFINPLAGTVETLFSLPGTTAQKVGRTINPMNLIRVYMDGLEETWKNAPQTLAGASGIVNSTGYGVGMQPSSLAAVQPREMNMSYVPWGQISKYRFNTPKLLKALGLQKAVELTRFSSWMASRSFQTIRGAEGWVGGTDKNTQFKRVAVEALMKQGKSFDEAWNMVQEALGPKNAEIWENAGKQADKEIAEGLVSKFSRKQRQTEIAQDVIDEQWNLDLKNRYREQSALAGYKQDPISPLGAWMYSQLSSVFNNDKSLMSNLKFSFLFARFFSNAIESAYFRTPIAGLMALGIKEPTGNLDERQQRIVQIFGSMDNYRDVRLGRAASGTAILGTLGALMIYSLLNWDPDDDEPPGPLWLTGDPIGEFGRKAIMESNSWWRPNTLYLFGKPVLNFVNASPEYAMAGAFAGNVGDRFMFDKLLNMKKDTSSDEWVRSDFQSFVAPFRDTVLAPWSRSTYQQWFAASEALFDGDGKKFAKLFANPFTGAAASLTIGIIPSVKTLEKVERMQYQPKAPKDIPQAIASSVPFANTLGLDMGQPMVTPFGEETTGFPFFSIMVNPQEVTETSRKAANLLAQFGITKLGTKEKYLGDGTSEVFNDGKRYLLSQEQRGRVLRQIGQTFAAMINANADKLRRLEKTKGKDAVSDEIDSYAKKARSKVLFSIAPARK